MNKQDQIIIFKSENGQTHVDVYLQDDNIWLTQAQLSDLFERDVRTINEHIKNIYKTEELEQNSTIRKFRIVRQEGKRKVSRDIDHYNLDMIISVGYRVNSKRGTQFRIWANSVLKDYLLKGYALNKRLLEEKNQQLQELKKVIALQEKVVSEYQLNSNEKEGLIYVIANYSRALKVLDDYDHQRLKLPEKSTQEVIKIDYEEARRAIDELGKLTHFEGLFGIEKDDSFKGSLANIYQTFDGEDLYQTTEEKAAHLLYFVVKNHSFTDGNKRIAAFLFVWFLERNGLLFKDDGEKNISDNALVALTLMLAESHPNDKDMMIKVIVNLLIKP